MESSVLSNSIKQPLFVFCNPLPKLFPAPLLPMGGPDTKICRLQTKKSGAMSSFSLFRGCKPCEGCTCLLSHFVNVREAIAQRTDVPSSVRRRLLGHLGHRRRTHERLTADYVNHSHHEAIKFLPRRYHTVITSASDVHSCLKSKAVYKLTNINRNRIYTTGNGNHV